jgi:BirA family transcriptional regulator, biotin operon repressor / biotin---[acetyl-CoA-carboxylase] ligase
MNMIGLTDERLRDALWPRPFRFYERVGSTNDIAAGWARENAPNGAVVIAEEQLSGRGRFERTWVAPPGSGLLFSVILRPRLTPERLSRVTMLGAVSLIEALRLTDELSLKWPNDVLLRGRKLAGILPEASWNGDQLAFVVLGIGLNVHTDFAGSPLEQTATSLAAVIQRPIDRPTLLAEILRRVDYWSQRAAAPELWEAWRSHLGTLGQPVQVTFTDGQTIMGKASDVDEDGALQLVDRDGAIHRLLAGEVTLRTDLNDSRDK